MRATTMSAIKASSAMSAKYLSNLRREHVHLPIYKNEVMQKSFLHKPTSKRGNLKASSYSSVLKDEICYPAPSPEHSKKNKHGIDNNAVYQLDYSLLNETNKEDQQYFAPVNFKNLRLKDMPANYGMFNILSNPVFKYLYLAGLVSDLFNDLAENLEPVVNLLKESVEITSIKPVSTNVRRFEVKEAPSIHSDKADKVAENKGKNSQNKSDMEVVLR